MDQILKYMKCLGLVSLKQVSTNSKQKWINQSSSHMKQRYYNSAQVSKSQNNRNLYNIIKKELQRECQKTYNNYVNNLISEDNSPTSKNCGRRRIL